MTLVDLNTPIVWPNIPSTAISTGAVGSATARVAKIIQVPRSGTLDSVGIRIAANSSGSGASVRVRLETVDSTTGNPTGTLIAAGAEGNSPTNLQNNTPYDIAMGTPPTVAKGDWIAVVVDNPAWTTGSITISVTTAAMTKDAYTTVATTTTGTTWTRQGSSTPMLALSIGGDWEIPFGCTAPSPYSSSVANTTASTNPDERGNRFTLPIAARVTGLAMVGFAITAAVDRTAIGRLTDLAGNVLASGNFSGIYKSPLSSSDLYHHIMFTDFVDLDAGFEGRISVESTGAGTIGFPSAVSSNVGSRPGGTSFYRTTRNNGGAWTDDANTWEHIGLLISHVSDGAGGAGSTRKFKKSDGTLVSV